MPTALFPRSLVPVISRFRHHQVDGGREAAPVGGFFFQLLAAGVGERVELGLAPGFAFRPLGLDPRLLLQPVERGIKRALLDLQDFSGNLLDALGNGPAVLCFE